MSAFSANISIATRATRNSNVLHLRTDATRLWAGLYPSRANCEAFAFSGCDATKGVAVLGSSLIMGAHYPMDRVQLRKAVLWLRAQGVAVDVKAKDAKLLGLVEGVVE